MQADAGEGMASLRGRVGGKGKRVAGTHNRHFIKIIENEKHSNANRASAGDGEDNDQKFLKGEQNGAQPRAFSYGDLKSETDKEELVSFIRFVSV